MENEFYTKLCGIYAADDGKIYFAKAGIDNSRICESVDFKPYAWTSQQAKADDFQDLSTPDNAGVSLPLNRLVRFENTNEFEKFMRFRNKALPFFRLVSIESQFLSSMNLHMFTDMRFDQIKRIQLDIEVFSEDEKFPNAFRNSDRIIAVGISGCGICESIELQSFDDDGERNLLERVQARILELDPDFIEGHNIFKFDLPYISTRCKKLKIPMQWGRFGFNAEFRRSRISIAERTINYIRCNIPGRTVIDTLLLVQFYDISAREMSSYTLKDSAIHFGISVRENRTYIEGSEIKNIFNSDRETFRKYLFDDLRETAGIAEHLLPTYVAQAQNFPMPMQECLLRGNGMKVESVFIQKYYARNASLPTAQNGSFFEGAMSEGFELGLFKNVLHYDVASLYPSLMLVIGKCPRNDYLKTFLDELRTLREYRLKYKKLARQATDKADKIEFDARQKSFKILINSFYGYLGLSTAIFSDIDLAGQITAMGRELLQKLITAFKELGCTILEADTDGIYLSSKEYFSKPEVLLEKVLHILPDGIDLDFDGAYSAMLCYKAKNYALLDGNKTILRGSAFRNRSVEPFLQNLTQTMISDILLEREDEIPKLIADTRELIKSGKADINQLAKSEYISKSPSAYKKEVEASGKGRRASLEASLLMQNQPAVGDKVSYYIAQLDGKKNPDWKCARPIEQYDTTSMPYNPTYYLKKIDDWQKRFSELFSTSKETATGQLELF